MVAEDIIIKPIITEKSTYAQAQELLLHQA